MKSVEVLLGLCAISIASVSNFQSVRECILNKI